MKLSQIKAALIEVDDVHFRLADGTLIPNNFHVTEIGKITKEFIDCGGTLRKEEVVNFQLWTANDYDHRLKPKKLINIIRLAEKKLNIDDLEIEVEYQAETIGKFGLTFDGQYFNLTQKQTDCLAKENCGIPSESLEVSEIASESCCTVDRSCC